MTRPIVAMDGGRLVPPSAPVFADAVRQAEITASIRAMGLLDPLVVRPLADGSFEIVDGLRRFQALEALGDRQVSAIVSPLGDEQAACLERLIRNAARRAICPIEEAHRTITVAHLGNVAMQLGRPVRWDPETERFPGDPAAERLARRAMRGDWSL